jgi:ammonia channel protein AmtB
MISSCDNIEPWAAFVIGILGGFEYIFLNRLLYKLQIDDPVDAVPIHFVSALKFIVRDVAFWARTWLHGSIWTMVFSMVMEENSLGSNF